MFNYWKAKFEEKGAFYREILVETYQHELFHLHYMYLPMYKTKQR